MASVARRLEAAPAEGAEGGGDAEGGAPPRDDAGALGGAADAAGGGGGAAPVSPEDRVPLSVKSRALEHAAYADLARLAGAYTLCASRWNANPALTSDLVVMRARETLPVQPLAAAAAGKAPSAFPPPFDEGAETSWRTLHYREDADAPAGLRVMVVTDTEADAAAAWKAVLSGAASPPATVSAAALPPDPSLPPSAAVAAPVAPELPPLPSFRAILEVGAQTRNSAMVALQARTTAEGLDVMARSSPLFVSAVEALLRLVRPLSFTRWGGGAIPT